MQWFYIQDGQRFGPVDESVLFNLARNGRLAPEDLVWNVTLGNEWIPASRIPNLFDLPEPARTSAGRLPGVTPNAMLMEKARRNLAGNWAIAIGATLLYGLITNGPGLIADVKSDAGQTIGHILELLVTVFISGPLMLGWNRFFLLIGRRELPELGRLFDGFRLYWKSVGTALLFGLYVLLACIPIFFASLLAALSIPILKGTAALPLAILLGSVLVIASTIPMIIVSLNYSVAFFVLSDQPYLGAGGALARSRQLMIGHRWKRLYLDARFIGWFLLCLLTCGIGFLWFAPYFATAHACFYDDIRTELSQQE